MKRLLALLLAVVMLLSLAACAEKTTTRRRRKDKDTDSTTAPATTAPSTTTPTSQPITNPPAPIVRPKTDQEIAMAEAEIRYAVGLLLDRSYIVMNITGGGELPASSLVGMGVPDRNGEFYENAGHSSDYTGYFDVSNGSYEKNFTEAMTILKKYYKFDEATKKFTNFPRLSYIYNTNDTHRRVAEYIQAKLAIYGIEVTLKNMDWGNFLDNRYNGNYDIARNGWYADYSDAICFLDMWTTWSGNNVIQFGKGDHAKLKIYNLDLTGLGININVKNGTWAQTYDELIEQIKQCTDTEKRYQMLHMAEDMLMATGCITPIYYYTDPYMIRGDVDGFYANPLGIKYFHKTTYGMWNSLAVCVGSEPDNLDPALNSAIDGHTMLAHLFSGLAKWDQDENGNNIIVPDCAVSLPEGVLNDDGTVTYTYTLKDGLKWSDGVDLTAYDFEFAWKRAASWELGADYGYMFEIVKGYGTRNKDDLAVKALDDKTLQVTLTNSITYWNELLAFPTYFPVRKDVVANWSWKNDAATFVSNGAYTMTSWKHKSVITLTKNEYYHDAANVTMGELKFYLSDDAGNMYTNYKNGDWQFIDEVPRIEIPGLMENNIEFVNAGQMGTYFICWNINQPLLPRD